MKKTTYVYKYKVYCVETNKACFDEIGAMMALSKLPLDFKGFGGKRKECRYYKCPHCEYYHLTSKA